MKESSSLSLLPSKGAEGVRMTKYWSAMSVDTFEKTDRTGRGKLNKKEVETATWLGPKGKCL